MKPYTLKREKHEGEPVISCGGFNLGHHSFKFAIYRGARLVFRAVTKREAGQMMAALNGERYR